MHHIFSSSPAIPTSALVAHEAEQPAAEDVREDVVHAATSAAAFPEALLAIPVVQLAFLGI